MRRVLQDIRHADGGWTGDHVAAAEGLALWTALVTRGLVWEDPYGRVLLTQAGNAVLDEGEPWEEN